MYLHCSTAQVKVSPNGSRIAFTVPALRGADCARALVRELPTAACGLAGMWDLAEIPAAAALEWLGDEHLLYTQPDASGRPHRAARLRVVGAGGEDTVLEEHDPARFLTLGTTKDGALVTVNANSKTSCEVLLSLRLVHASSY